MSYSLSSQIKIPREELVNIALDYQHELKTKFTKMEPDLAISRNVNLKLVERLIVTERKCWANEQYSRRKCLEISGISESVSHNALEDKIQGVLRGIDVEIDTENIESCHRLK